MSCSSSGLEQPGEHERADEPPTPGWRHQSDRRKAYRVPCQRRSGSTSLPRSSVSRTKEALDLAALARHRREEPLVEHQGRAGRPRPPQGDVRGLIRDQQPEEPAARLPSGRPKKAAAKAEAVTTLAEPASVATVTTVEPVVEEPPVRPTGAERRASGRDPGRRTGRRWPRSPPPSGSRSPSRRRPPPNQPCSRPAASTRIISSTRQVAPLPITPPPPPAPARAEPADRPAAGPSCRSGRTQRHRGTAPPRGSPMSPPILARLRCRRAGKPIPPPPGRPLSPSGRPIPPPPGGPRPVTRSGGAGGPRPGVGRPTGAGGRGLGARRSSRRIRRSAPRRRPQWWLRRSTPWRRTASHGGRRPPKRRGGRRRRNLEELQPQQLLDYRPSTAPVPEGTIIVERGSSAQDHAPS